MLLFSQSSTLNSWTLFLSLSKVELVKGNLQSVGLTLRLVQSTDGYSGHVIIETVAPNSPAAIAELQRGDRLIAIGGNQYIASFRKKPVGRGVNSFSFISLSAHYFYSEKKGITVVQIKV